MPLLFNSISHGDIPFGFFNIETDMVLLNDHFLFAEDMAGHVSRLAESPLNGSIETAWEAYVLRADLIGNLMGAIAGVDLRGFIGEVYSHFPFPHEPDKFRQNPEGYGTRGLIEGIVTRYTTPTMVPVVIEGGDLTIVIGPYRFSRPGFERLLEYLWFGGYPRWKEMMRPPYIIAMKEAVEQSSNPFFAAMTPGRWSS